MYTYTGRLLAIVLRTLGMNIETCIDEYLEIAPEVS